MSAFYDDDFSLRYLELIAQFNVPTGTKIKNLSKGQRAKVALALATAHDPELLILDEPTSGLDPMVRRQFLESMVDRAASGRTVLLSASIFALQIYLWGHLSETQMDMPTRLQYHCRGLPLQKHWLGNSSSKPLGSHCLRRC